jgi:hypothetical protein
MREFFTKRCENREAGYGLQLSGFGLKVPGLQIS